MKTKQKLRGVSLLAAVFGELSQQLPVGVASTVELLGAAQKLIELSKREFVTDGHAEERPYKGYYSYDLCTAFGIFQGRILETEVGLQSDPLAGRGLRALEMYGSREDMGLEEIYG